VSIWEEEGVEGKGVKRRESKGRLGSVREFQKFKIQNSKFKMS